MEKINKILVGALILLFALLAVQVAQACACPRITCLDVNYDMVSYTGYVELENTGDKNITVVIVIYVDNNRTLEREVALNIEYFKGFRLRTSETVEFEAPCEEGKHEVRVTVIVDNMSLLGNVSYISQGCIEDVDEEEEVHEYGCGNISTDFFEYNTEVIIVEQGTEEKKWEDWLGCP